MPVALSLARLEYRIGARTTAFRLLGLAALALGWVSGNAPGRGVSVSAYGAGESGWQYLGFATIVWMALAAVRDTYQRTEALIYSKPQTTERLVLAKFLGAFGQALVLLVLLFAGALCGRFYVAHSLLGFTVYGVQFVRAAVALFFAASASFSLALLADSPVAGAVVGLYWVVMLAGKEYLAKIYFPAYTQNLPVYLTIGALILCIALWFHRRSRRGDQPAPAWVRLSAFAALLVAIGSVRAVVWSGHDPQAITSPFMELVARQNIVFGERAPGFLLPDQAGRPTTLSGLHDRVLLIALWSPRDQESGLLLARLNDLYLRYGSRGVQPVAICISEDTGAAATFAAGERVAYPVVADWGTHNAPKSAESSPVASAYQATTLPMVVVTDRSRRVRSIIAGIATYDGPELETEIERRLRAEPE